MSYPPASVGGVERLSWAQVCARRLDRHGLSAPWPDATPDAIAAAMCGAHAQVLSAGELSIGVRAAELTRADVRAAVDGHSLVKTYGPRGTVHLLPARDLPMWTGALAAAAAPAPPRARAPAPPGGRSDGARLTPEQSDAVVAAIAAALADAELTIDELGEAVVDATGPWAADPVVPAFAGMWPRWRPALGTAAHRGVLCFGPTRERRVTYTHPGRWLPGFAPQEPATALAGLVGRYLHAYGPATPAQFAQWLGVPRPWAARLFASLDGELERVDVEGGSEPAWVVSGDTTAPDEPPRGVRLLPYFDGYAVGCHPRERLFPGPAAARALSPTGQAGTFPVLLVDGTVAGVWHQRRSGRRLSVTVEPLRRLTAAQRRELSAGVDRIGAFHGAPADLTVGTVTARSHL